MGYEIPEVEEIISKKYQEKVDSGERVYFNEYFLKEALNELVQYEYHAPFTFDNRSNLAYRAGTHTVLVKARNAGTTIMRIDYTCHFTNNQGWYVGDFILDDIKVHSMTKKVTDFQTLIDYLEERAKIIDAKDKKKIDDFIDKCQTKGIDIKDFFELEREFLSKDSFTRSRLQGMGNK